MKFVLKGEVYFYAENINDAFKKLSDHFYKLTLEENNESNLFESGEIEIYRPAGEPE